MLYKKMTTPPPPPFLSRSQVKVNLETTVWTVHRCSQYGKRTNPVVFQGHTHQRSRLDWTKVNLELSLLVLTNKSETGRFDYPLVRIGRTTLLSVKLSWISKWLKQFFKMRFLMISFQYTTAMFYHRHNKLTMGTFSINKGWGRPLKQ